MPGTHNSDVFVLDNGGYTLKAGFSNQPSCKVLPNSITKAKSEKRRAFIADQAKPLFIHLSCNGLGLYFRLALPSKSTRTVLTVNQRRKAFLWAQTGSTHEAN